MTSWRRRGSEASALRRLCHPPLGQTAPMRGSGAPPEPTPGRAAPILQRRSYSADHHPANLRYTFPGGSPFFGKEWRSMRVRDELWRTSSVPLHTGGMSQHLVESNLSYGAHRYLPPYSTEASTIGNFHYAQTRQPWDRGHATWDYRKDNATWYLPPFCRGQH